MKSQIAFLLVGGLAGAILGHQVGPSARAVATGPRSQPAGIEVGFSPDGRAEQLVLRTISGARKTIRMSAYAFTSRPVAQALVAARHRGVSVRLVADTRSNADSPYARAALGALVNAGAEVRLNDHYAIHHDKFIIADDDVLETGSFNYTASAATRNSENAIVLTQSPEIVGQYGVHWQTRFDEARPYLDMRTGER